MRHKNRSIALLVLVSSCTTELPLPSDGGKPPAGSPPTTNPPATSGNVIITDPADSGLEPLVRIPFCCSALEREFSVLLDGDELPGGAVCNWQFGDGFSADSCTVTHTYPWNGAFTAALSVRLPGGTTESAEFVVQIGSAAPVAETPAVSLQASAGSDIEAAAGEFVQLHPSITVSPESAAVTVSWRQVSGPTVYLEEAFTSCPSFTMPQLSPGSELVFEVIAASGGLTATSRLTVAAGEAQYADAVWADDPRFGYSAADATLAVQRAIDAGSAVVVVPNLGRDWLVSPIELRSNLRLVLEPGVVLAAKPGAYPSEYDSVLSAENVENLVIEGYGAVIRMPRDEYIPPFAYPDYVAGEWRHAIALRGVSNGEVLGVRIEGTGGDGIYISSAWDSVRTPCSDIVVRDCYVAQSYRNGIAVTSGENILVDGCTVTGTSGTLPKAGLIVEPNHYRDRVVNVEFHDTTVVNNEGSAFVISVSKLNHQSLPVSVLISDCRASYSGQPSLRAMMTAESAPRGTIEFRRCEVEGIYYSGAWGRWDPGAAIRLRFVDCVWRDVARNSWVTPIAFEMLKSASASSLGGIEFSGCVLFDEKLREPFVVTAADVTAEAFNIFGELRVVSQVHGRVDDVPAPLCPELLLDYSTTMDGP